MMKHVRLHNTGGGIDLVPRFARTNDVGVERTRSEWSDEKMCAPQTTARPIAVVPLDERVAAGDRVQLHPTFDGHADAGANVERGAGGNPHAIIGHTKKERLPRLACGETNATLSRAMIGSRSIT